MHKLCQNFAQVLQTALRQAVQAINSHMELANWEISRIILEEVLAGRHRVECGCDYGTKYILNAVSCYFSKFERTAFKFGKINYETTLLQHTSPTQLAALHQRIETDSIKTPLK